MTLIDGRRHSLEAFVEAEERKLLLKGAGARLERETSSVSGNGINLDVIWVETEKISTFLELLLKITKPYFVHVVLKHKAQFRNFLQILLSAKYKGNPL